MSTLEEHTQPLINIKLVNTALSNKTNRKSDIITNNITQRNEKKKKEKRKTLKFPTENEIFLEKCNYYKINNCYRPEMNISEIEFYKKREIFLKEKKIYLAKQKQEVVDNEINEISTILDDLSLYNTVESVQKKIVHSVLLTPINIKIDRSIYLDYLESPTQTKFTINNTKEFADVPFYYDNPEFNNDISDLTQHKIDDTEYFMANNNNLYVLNKHDNMVLSTKDDTPMTYNPIYMPLKWE